MFLEGYTKQSEDIFESGTLAYYYQIISEYYKLNNDKVIFLILITKAKDLINKTMDLWSFSIFSIVFVLLFNKAVILI